MGRILSQLGYIVDYAADGLEAVARVACRFLQAQTYSLLLMVRICTIPRGGGGGGEASVCFESCVRTLEDLDPHILSHP